MTRYDISYEIRMNRSLLRLMKRRYAESTRDFEAGWSKGYIRAIEQEIAMLRRYGRMTVKA